MAHSTNTQGNRRESVFRSRLYRLAGLAACLCAGLAHAQLSVAPSRLIDVIDVDEKDTQVDVTLQFNCSLRYTGHSPASEGSELRLRLRPDRDCGTTGSMTAAGEIPTEIPPLSAPRGIVSTARLESSLGNEVTLTLTWTKPESFVLAQGASPRGMRIRLIRSRPEKARILVTDRGDTATNFAVNLESQREP